MWMARHGKTYREILAHYFPHTQLSELRVNSCFCRDVYL